MIDPEATPPPYVPPEDHKEHDDDKEFHVQVVTIADETFNQAQEVLIEGRRRLQEVVARYEERARDPR